ncbi:hypothetical protein BH20GEM2_BH20GEM2_16060 [soil metagenome]
MGSGRERWLAAGMVMVVVALALLVGPDAERNTADPRPSTLLATPRGTRAVYLAFGRLDIPVEQRLTPFADADPLVGPLVMLAPGEPPTPHELAALAEYLQAGGTLIYAARPGDPTLELLGLRLESVEDRDTDSVGATATADPTYHALTRGMRPVPGFRWVFADSSPALDGPVDPLLVTASGRETAVRYRFGEGGVLAFSDAAPFTNLEIQGGGAALLLARAATAVGQPGARLRFDEYHHGFRAGGSAVGGTFRFLRDTPLGHAALQLALATAGLLWLVGSRFGGVVAAPPPRRRSPLEHVRALAEAYRQAGADDTVRRLLLSGLARRTGRRPPRDAGEAAALLGRSGPEELPASPVALAREIDLLLSHSSPP